MIISPSFLAADLLNLKEQLKDLDESAAQWLHFDVMDGHFVPNISFGPNILEGIASGHNLVKDVHLMVEDPLKFANYFLPTKPDYLTIHYEAIDNSLEFVDFCIKNNIKPGISIKPNTPVEVLEEIADYFSLVLIMSVEPGFGNQKFIPKMLEKITYLNLKKHNYLISVDGGINVETAKLCKEVGVDVLVSGSYVFKGNIKENIESLL